MNPEKRHHRYRVCCCYYNQELCHSESHMNPEFGLSYNPCHSKQEYRKRLIFHWHRNHQHCRRQDHSYRVQSYCYNLSLFQRSDRTHQECRFHCSQRQDPKQFHNYLRYHSDYSQIRNRQGFGCDYNLMKFPNRYRRSRSLHSYCSLLQCHLPTDMSLQSRRDYNRLTLHQQSDKNLAFRLDYNLEHYQGKYHMDRPRRFHRSQGDR